MGHHDRDKEDMSLYHGNEGHESIEKDMGRT